MEALTKHVKGEWGRVGKNPKIFRRYFMSKINHIHQLSRDRGLWTLPNGDNKYKSLQNMGKKHRNTKLKMLETNRSRQHYR
jgi:hypothetical protein